MTKFQCTENKQDFVEVVRDKNDKLALTIGDNHSVSVAFLAPSDAPALALAILEAAGYTEGDKMAKDAARSHFGDAVESLAVGVGEQGRATAEAKAQAKLEAEALELANTYLFSMGVDLRDSFYAMTPYNQEHWLAVARKAREMAKETPSA